MDASSRARALCRTYLAYRAMGAELLEGPGCLAVRQDVAPIVHDVNHVQVIGKFGVDVGVEVEVEADALLAFLDSTFHDREFRQVLTTPFSGPRLEARLSHEGFKPDPTLQGLLVGDLAGPPPRHFEIRPVAGEEDWRRLDRLVRADHVETDARRGSAVFSEELTRQIQTVRRLAADRVHFFMAWLDDEPVAFFSSWPGVDGVGMLEDLFTLPSHRNRGVARALIHHCVADARARGAGPVLIGSVPDDTPKEIYAAMGFEPTCLTWNWLKRVSADSVPD
jgi:GNAT superfamily N-acetyltransferase